VTYAPKSGDAPREMEVTIRTLTKTSDGWMKASTIPVFEKRIGEADKDGRFSTSFDFDGKAAEKAQTK
jgi:hypothetical protein